METFPVGWLTEFETTMEDPFVIHRMDSLDDLTSEQLAALFDVDVQSTSSNHTRNDGPTKQLKITTDSKISQESYAIQGHPPKAGRGRKGTRNPTAKSSCTDEHVIAERKRREKLAQQFIALSAIVPGLKKMDKVSVLGDCMNYIKQHQARVKTIEEKTSMKTMESAIYVKKNHISSDIDSSSTDEISSNLSHESLPEVQARVSDGDVLIRIHCEKHKGILAQMLLETEKLNLSVVSSSVMPFGSSTFDITVLAKMDAQFNMTVKNLVKKLHSFVVQFMGKNLPQD